MTTPREALVRAGIDVDALVGRLVSAAGAELGAVYRHTVLAAQLIGFTDEGLREILRDIREEDHRHFDALVTRVHELGGSLPLEIHGFLGADDGPREDVFAGSADVQEALVESARQAVRRYARLRDLTAGRDQRTHALADAIHNEKSEHVAWLEEFFGLGPPGRFRRGFRGASPSLARLADSDRPGR
jgi:ferritin-like protein